MSPVTSPALQRWDPQMRENRKAPSGTKELVCRP